MLLCCRSAQRHPILVQQCLCPGQSLQIQTVLQAHCSAGRRLGMGMQGVRLQVLPQMARLVLQATARKWQGQKRGLLCWLVLGPH